MNVPQGWKLVPTEPTKEMADEAWKYGINGEAPDPVYSYKAMLQAAPTPPAPKPAPGSWIPVQTAIDDYLSGYECDDGESICHAPNELESLLIYDAVAGLLGDEKFSEEYGKWLSQKAPTQPAQGIGPLCRALQIPSVSGLRRGHRANTASAGTRKLLLHRSYHE